MTDAFLTLWLRDGSTVRIAPHHGAAIEAALERYAGGGVIHPESDTLLRLTQPGGSRVVMLASGIFGFNVSNPVSRRMVDELEARVASEKSANSQIPENGKSELPLVDAELVS